MRDLTGILVGGASQRMGMPKGLAARSDGRRVIDTVVAATRAGGPCVLLGRSAYGLDLPWLPDDDRWPGPLGALAALFRFATTARVLVVSCDLASLDPVALTELREHTSRAHALAVANADGVHVDPLFARYERREALRALEHAGPSLRSPRALFEALRGEAVSLSDPRWSLDWDTPDDVARGGGRLPRRT